MASVYVHRDIDDLLRTFDKYSPKNKEDADKRIDKEGAELLAELLKNKDVLNLLIKEIKEHGLLPKFGKLIAAKEKLKSN
ncbi:MAG TPA: hypothetical protein VJI13_02815 [Candidatus Norongarragalinales archaeon]|nr:hypothetical protein [Candidatus Norongarragalinales archaeon]